MTHENIDENGQQFMIRLFEETGGDSSVQVSMYDIGGLLGLDRDGASKIAEELMGAQLVEIRTLSGENHRGSNGIIPAQNSNCPGVLPLD